MYVLKAAAVLYALCLLPVPPPPGDCSPPPCANGGGTLAGTVTGPEGTALELAAVVLSCPSVHLERALLTGSDGTYRFTGLPPAGDCRLEVSYPGGGLSPVTQEGIEIVAGKTRVEGFALPAALTEKVVVSSRSSVLGARAENFKAIINGVTNQDVVGGTFISHLLQFEPGPFNTESYAPVLPNPFRDALDHPLSTFAVDVDTASYSNIRRFLTQGQLPPPDAVRIEEMINYFRYDYAQPEDEHPFSVDIEVTGCPWGEGHRLVRIGLQGDRVAALGRPPANLVFLLDVSGSMRSADKLPLVKRSLRMLTEHLAGGDTVALAVYAGAAGLVLPPTGLAERDVILDALQRLQAGGSTAGGQGLRLAYRIARENFIPGAINRVILATDGDFNVGLSSTGAMQRLIQEEARSGVFLTVLGYGMGNLQDDKLETLADWGNGHYAYVDSLAEAKKVLVEELGATLVTIAKDVKIQVEFNPAQARAYRLIGYENRLLRAEEFNDDRRDAGEIGAGHAVTALYEVIPADGEAPVTVQDDLRYQRPAALSEIARQGELLTVKVRYKAPDGDTSRLLQVPVTDSGGELATASEDTRFAAAVALAGMALRGEADDARDALGQAEQLARAGLGADPNGYRAGFLDLARQARELR